MSTRVTARRAYRPASPAPSLSPLNLASQLHLDVAKIEQFIAADERRLAREAVLAFNGAYTEMSAALPVIEEHGVLRHGDQVVGSYALWEDMVVDFLGEVDQRLAALTCSMDDQKAAA